jgi:4-hydroxybenzoate polyprenyltransferase
MSRFSNYAELLRLPNVFTALADVLMGYLVVRPFDAEDGPMMALILGASALLYCAGMVLNDVCDYHLDLEERPERPLPSGRVGRTTAAGLGTALLLLGLVAGWAAGSFSHTLRPGIVATALAVLILLYDGVLKPTVLGPLAMGGCRMLNVLLGMSVYPGHWHPLHWLIAAAVGTYILGVTWFARDEAGRSRPFQLVPALIVMMTGVGLLACLPYWSEEVQPLLQRDPQRWYLLVGLLAMLIGWRCVRAIFDPRAANVRRAVKQCLLSLIILDAVACFSVRGQPESIAILLLLVPTFLLARLFSPT